MFLTRFRLNTARREGRHLLGSPHRLHAAVAMSLAAPPPHAGNGPRLLWRIDRNNPADTVLYVVSPARPDMTHLVEQAGWPASDTPGWQTYDYGTFLNRLTADSTWNFRLTANPVHHIRRKDDEPTKRTAHMTPRHQTAWLVNRQEQSGFTIQEKPQQKRALPEGDELQLIIRDKRNLRFTKKPGSPPVQLTTVTYDGRLTVTDPEALRRTLTHGLGKAKAYGCGLMTLAPTG